MANECNCGICDLVNDCYFDGRWESCKVNKMVGKIESQQQAIEQLKLEAHNDNLYSARVGILLEEVERLKQMNDVLSSDKFHAEGNLEIMTDLHKRCVDMLKWLEWCWTPSDGIEPSCCPECGNSVKEGHAENCELASLIGKGGEQ